MEIGQTLFAKIEEGLERETFREMLTDCGMCRTQIEHGTGVSTIHPVRILAAAYGLLPL
ncbi:MAG: hypothetical protein ACYCV0_18485 [Desulfitobacteriaceae bacterium]